MTRWCAYERARFDEVAFEPDPKYGWVHKADPRHTINGEVIRDDPGTIPGPADVDYPPDQE
jgi:hypothetical protein